MGGRRRLFGRREGGLTLCIAMIIGCHLSGGAAATIGIPVAAIGSLLILLVPLLFGSDPRSEGIGAEPPPGRIARESFDASNRGVDFSALGTAFRREQWELVEERVDALLDACLKLIRLHLAPHTVAAFFPAPQEGYELRRFWSRSDCVKPGSVILPGQGVLGGLMKNGVNPLTVGEIVSDSTTLFYYDRDAGVRSLVACPIVSGDEVRGLLLADSTVPGAFGETHLAFMSAMGSLLGSAAESVYRGTHHALEHRRFAAVSEIEKTFFRLLSVDAILDLVAEIVPYVSPCDRMTVSTRLDDGESARIRRISGSRTERLLGAKFSLAEKNLAGILYVKGICFTRNFAADRYEIRYFDKEPRDDRLASFLAVPLGIDECRGLILLESFRADAYPAPLRAMMSRIATSAGLAMERILLLESATSLATHDSLTGLANHRQFLVAVKDEIVRSKRFCDPLSLVLGDIDFFKKINDSYGHPFGNTVLKGLGALLAESIRQRVDTAARYGGEEFALILVKTDARQARETADRIRGRIEATPFASPAGKEVRITMSFGIAELGESADLDEMIGRADKALYRAKELGRNRVEVF
jgi:diguanylate cyclase (GGDEF)-like protein